jgi:hypothetical protein
MEVCERIEMSGDDVIAQPVSSVLSVSHQNGISSSNRRFLAHAALRVGTGRQY